MEERLEARFAEEMEARGFGAWWEAEAVWDEIGEVLVAEGFNADMVEDYIAEMAWEL